MQALFLIIPIENDSQYHGSHNSAKVKRFSVEQSRVEHHTESTLLPYFYRAPNPQFFTDLSTHTIEITT